MDAGYSGVYSSVPLTPVVLTIVAIWILVFPMVMMLNQIAAHKKLVATGSDNSFKWRDRYERTFGAALLLVLAVVLFELMPLIVYFYHQLRLTHLDDSVQWKEYLKILAMVSVALGILSGAPRLLSVLSGVWQKLAIALIAFVGLLVPLFVIVVVSDFLVYVSMLWDGSWTLLVVLYVLTPFIYAVGIGLVIFVGLLNRTFSRGEYIRLVALFISMIVGHLILIAVLSAVWFFAFFLYQHYPQIVPDILLADDETRKMNIYAYGDLSAYIVVGVALELWLFCWLTVDINLTSMHCLYRDRLASAYLLGLNARGQVGIEEDIPLSELCRHATGSTAPYHLINVALNLQGSKDLNLRDRQSDFFIFSKNFIGGARTGYCRTATMEQVYPQINLASAMAISAAAASPNMGRSTSPALVAFMTLINVRLGVWIPNPGLIEESFSSCKETNTKEVDLDERKPGFTFEEVFLDELVSMKKRWEQLGHKGAERHIAECKTPTPVHGLAGIGLSGGGIRSATFNLGIVQALHHAGIFDHFDYISTVSGGGYLGSGISALMRYKTKPVSEIAGKVAVKMTSAGEKIVTITHPDEARIYRYSKDAEVELKTGDYVKPGTRLIRRSESRHWSEIAGTVEVERLEGGQQIVRIIGKQPHEMREYRFTRYDELNVKPGDSIEIGKLLIKEQNSFGTRFSWRVRPKALLREMTMRLDETYHWVNLSDGGHIENLAAIELLRRRCKLIVVGDGEADPNLHFHGMATLMRTARIDLGIQIDICLDELRLGASHQSKAHLAIGRITYPGESECGYLLYLKSSYTGDENEVIGEYRRRRPTFPHESTADQFFDEGQFEAYRALGQHIGEKAIEALALKSSPEKLAFTELAGCFQGFWNLEKKKKT